MAIDNNVSVAPQVNSLLSVIVPNPSDTSTLVGNWAVQQMGNPSSNTNLDLLSGNIRCYTFGLNNSTQMGAIGFSALGKKSAFTNLSSFFSTGGMFFSSTSFSDFITTTRYNLGEIKYSSPTDATDGYRFSLSGGTICDNNDKVRLSYLKNILAQGWTSSGDFNVSGNLLNSGVSLINYFNVKNYGAKGDGVTNDASAIQSSIDAAIRAGGGEVFFPQGSYLSSGLLNVTGNNITLNGNNKLATILAFDQDDVKKIKVSGGNNISIIGLNFDGRHNDKTDGNNLSGILTLEDCHVINASDNNFFNAFGTAILLYGDTQVVSIRNNYFTGNFCGIYSYTKGTDATYATGNTPQRVLIDGNTFGDSWANGAESAAIKIQNNSSYTGFSEGFIVTNNNINSMNHIGIEFWKHLANSNIQGNSIANTAFGISIDGSKNISVIGNNVRTNTFGIEAATSCTNILFEGNTINGYGLTGTTRVNTYGMSASNAICDKIAFIGNTVFGCTYGLNVENATNTTIANNYFKDNQVQVQYQAASLSNLVGNIFETGANTAGYQIFFDASSVSLSGFHIANNKFRGHTTDQSIYYYTNFQSHTISDVCVENNVTDGTTLGGFGTFIGGQITPSNYVYRNNFGPTGANAANSILDANDTSSPYKISDLKIALQYYADISYTLPSAGIADKTWLCVWSGDQAGAFAMRTRVTNDYVLDNKPTDCEIFSVMTPYDTITHALTSNPQSNYNGTLVQQIRTQSEQSWGTASLWVRYGAVSSDAAGGKIYSYFSQANGLTGIYATTVEPTWVSQSAALYPSQLDYEAFKVSNGITIGNATQIYSSQSGRLNLQANTVAIKSNYTAYDLEMSGIARISQRQTLVPNIILSTLNTGALNFAISNINDSSVGNTGLTIGSYIGNSISTNIFIDEYANLGINGFDYTTNFRSGQGVMYLKDFFRRPSGAPSNGGCFFSSGGALHWQGSAGTITKIANA